MFRVVRSRSGGRTLTDREGGTDEGDKASRAWHTAENLEREARAVEPRIQGHLDLRKDFHSYALVNRTDRLTGTEIETHNAVERTPLGDRYCSIFHMEGIDPVALGTVVDLGCGLGLTSAALKPLAPRAGVVGIDVGAEAIAYARRHFPACEFVANAIAQEFYPLTRIDDWSYQREWVRFLLTHLYPRQPILCVLSYAYRRSGEPTIWRNWDRLREEFGATVGEVPVPKLAGLGLCRRVNVAAARLLRLFNRYRHAGIDCIVIRTPISA